MGGSSAPLLNLCQNILSASLVKTERNLVSGPKVDDLVQVLRLKVSRCSWPVQFLDRLVSNRHLIAGNRRDRTRCGICFVILDLIAA